MRKQRYWRMLLAAAFLFLLAAQAAQAAIAPATTQRLWSDDATRYNSYNSSDKFGWSVSVSGDTAVIGAMWHDDDIKGMDVGSAYVFIKGAGGSWSQQAKLTPDDGASRDRFGVSVSLSGDGSTVLIGASDDDNYGYYASGSAYIFVKQADGSWHQQAKLTADDGTGNDQFGASVSLSGDGRTALIGANYDDDYSSDAGSAYIFVKQADGSWHQQAKFTPDNSNRWTPYYFGADVSLSSDGGTALIGERDSAYIFVKQADGSWRKQAQLHAETGWRFGSSVSLSANGSVALIGVPEDNDKGEYSGSAYVFVKGTDGSWHQQAKLTADDGAWLDHFGYSVSLSSDGGTALIGARYEGDNGSGSRFGAAYVFVKGTDGSWSQQVKLTAYNSTGYNEELGRDVSLSADGGTVLIGAPEGKNEVNLNPGVINAASGVAYVFSFPSGYGRALPASTYLMTAPPCLPAPTDIGSQYSELGICDTDWAAWAWDAAGQSYDRMACADPLVLGAGNWLYSRNAATLTVTGTATPTTDCAAYGSSGPCFDIDLVIPSPGQSRWNFVGHPFPYTVSWADVKVAMSNNGGATWAVYSPSQAEAAGYVSKTFYRWNGNAYDPYDDVTMDGGTLQPQEAVWVRSLGSYSGGPAPQKLKLLIPAR